LTNLDEALVKKMGVGKLRRLRWAEIVQIYVVICRLRNYAIPMQLINPSGRIGKAEAWTVVVYLSVVRS
jgi:hypothetical protein